MQDDDPVVQRRRLRVALRQLRTATGNSVIQVAGALGWSHSKVVRIENGDVGLSLTDLRALLAHYGVTEPTQVDEYVNMAKISRRQPSVNQYIGTFSKETLSFFQLQQRAREFRHVEPMFVPGLLQTERYMEAVLRRFSKNTDEDFLQRKSRGRLEHHELIFAPDHDVQMYFIIDEAVLRRRIGDDNAIMVEQIESLREISRRSNVHLQVAPFSAGLHVGMRGPFVILELPIEEDDNNILYFENPRGDVVVREDQEEIRSYLAQFYDLQKESVPEEEIDAFLERVVSDLVGA